MKKIISLIAATVVIALTLSMAILPLNVFADTVDCEIAVPEGYALAETLITDESGKLGNARILESYNWAYKQNSLVAYMDNADGCQRIEANGYNEEAYIVLSVDDSMAVKVGMTIYDGHAETASNTYYASADGVKWTRVGIAAYNVETIDEVNGYTDYFGRVELVTNLPKGTTQLRIVTNNSYPYAWYNPFLDFINVYEKLPEGTTLTFDTALDTYEDVAEKTYFGDNTAIGNIGFYSYSNMTIGAQGYGYLENNHASPTATSDAYIILAVDETKALEVGTMIYTGNEATNSINYYVSEDAVLWSKLNADNVLTKDTPDTPNKVGTKTYCLRQDRVVNLPEATKYVKVEVVTPTVSWTQLGIDYIDVYSLASEESTLDYNTALSDYNTDEKTTYFDNNTAIESVGVYSYNNMKVASAGLGYREANYAIPTATSDAYVVLKADDLTALEVGTKIANSRIGDTFVNYYVSEDAATWTKLGDSNVFTNEDTTTISGYCLRMDRVVNLPLSTRYIKVEVVTAATWQPGVDYIDVYTKDAEKSERFDSERFDKALNDYKSEAVTTYFDIAGNTALEALYSYENGSMKSGGVNYQAKESNYFALAANGTGNFVIAIDDENALEIASVIEKSRIAATSIEFFTSSNAENWSELSKISIASKYVYTKDDGSDMQSNNAYFTRIDRLFDLPEGTAFIKVEITGHAWQPGIDHVSVFESGHKTAAFVYNEFTCLYETVCSDCGEIIYCGDVNADDEIDARDVVRIKKHLGDKENVVLEALAGDTDSDGEITATDMSWIRTALLAGMQHYYYF